MVTLGAKTVEKNAVGRSRTIERYGALRRHQGQVNCNLDGMKHSTMIAATSITITTMEQLAGINPNRLKQERRKKYLVTLHLLPAG